MKIIRFKTINSTNTFVKKNIDELSDKSVVMADIQTQGYGRFCRKWVDLGSQNIFMTFVLKPSENLKKEHANLTQYLSVCLCNQLESFGLTPKIKWPNDVLLNDKKVCGILAETVLNSNKLKGIALGIGINLYATKDSLNEIDRPATALNLEGLTVDKNEFAQKLVEAFFENYEQFLEKGFVFIKKDYEKYSINLDTCKVAIFNTVKNGDFKGFSDDGELLILSNGVVEKINMGEIVF